MSSGFVRVRDKDFYLDERKIILSGLGIGSWLNLEHFMTGIPGTDSQIRAAIVNSYGAEKAERFWQQYYRSMVNKKDFEFLKSLGINTLRIPFNYHLFESDQNPYAYREEGFKELDRVLRLCEQYELFAVLDLHAAPGGQNPDWHSDNATGESLFWEYADFRKRTVSLWKYIAERYAANRSIAAYDLLNEPVLMIPDRKILNQFFIELISEIRTVDKNHLLFVEGDMYAARFEMFESFEDPNVACSFHFYPFLHIHLSKKKKQRDRIEESLFKQVSLQDILERLKRPVWCGETGAVYNQGRRIRQVSMLEDLLRIYREQGISWSVWSYKDAGSMGLVHPKKDSQWLNFSKLVKGEWDFWQEFANVDRYAEELMKKYQADIPELEKRKIGFRILANTQLVLKERYNRIFEDIPFDTLLGYLRSFDFGSCEVWDDLARLVRNYSKSEK